jgi:ribosomal protein L37AE/L43A
MLISHIFKCHPGHDKSTFQALKSTIQHEEQNWLCPYCERKYLSSGKRREHIKKSHPNKAIPPSIKKAGRVGANVSVVTTSQRVPHICPYCPMEYAHRTKLLKHCKGTEFKFKKEDLC